MANSIDAIYQKQMDFLLADGIAGSLHIRHSLKQARAIDRVITEKVFSELPLHLRADFLRAVRMRDSHTLEAAKTARKLHDEFLNYGGKSS